MRTSKCVTVCPEEKVGVFQFGKLPNQVRLLEFDVLACNSKPALNGRTDKPTLFDGQSFARVGDGLHTVLSVLLEAQLREGVLGSAQSPAQSQAGRVAFSPQS